jgi:hypothetical protein
MRMKMMNKILEELSRENGYTDLLKGSSIQIGDPVLMRSERTVWAPCIYMGGTVDGPDYFRSCEGWHSMIAPLLGNERAAGYQSDVFDLIDEAWLKERGRIEPD